MRAGQRPRAVFIRFLKSGWGILTALGTVLGLAGSALAFCPHFSVSAIESSEKGAMFNTRFQLSNDGSIPAYDVEIDIFTSKAIGEGKTVENQLLGIGEADTRELLPYEHITLEYFPIALSTSHLDYIDMTIIMRYRPLLLPWKQTGYFRFIGRRNSDETYRFSAQPHIVLPPPSVHFKITPTYQSLYPSVHIGGVGIKPRN